MSIIVGLHWKLSLLTDPLISGYLYLWPPLQNPVYDIFLNSYTNSVFLNFLSSQLQPFRVIMVSTSIASTLFFCFKLQFCGSLFLLGHEQQSHYYIVVVYSFGIILIRISKLSEITLINLLLLQKRQMNPPSQ